MALIVMVYGSILSTPRTQAIWRMMAAAGSKGIRIIKVYVHLNPVKGTAPIYQHRIISAQGILLERFLNPYLWRQGRKYWQKFLYLREELIVLCLRSLVWQSVMSAQHSLLLGLYCIRSRKSRKSFDLKEAPVEIFDLGGVVHILKEPFPEH